MKNVFLIINPYWKRYRTLKIIFIFGQNKYFVAFLFFMNLTFYKISELLYSEIKLSRALVTWALNRFHFTNLSLNCSHYPAVNWGHCDFKSSYAKLNAKIIFTRQFMFGECYLGLQYTVFKNRHRKLNFMKI